MQKDSDQSRVTKFLSFLLPAIPRVSAVGARYDHMGALLADVALQAGLRYETVVAPRVRHVIDSQPNARRTQDVIRLLESMPAEQLLLWKGADKVKRYRRLVEVCAANDADTVGDLREFVATSEGEKAFMAIRGVGPKTFDYLRLLCGIATFPMDRHFVRFLRIAGVKVNRYDYAGSQRLLSMACNQLNLAPGPLERGLWLLLRDC
jgi:hypothetical protein